MKLGSALIQAAALSCFTVEADAAPPRGGETYEITRISQTSEQTDDQGSGSSYDKDTLVERVVAVRSDGLELEYDLPSDAKREERASQWQFPVRIFKPRSGPAQLLNRAELDRRLDAWLKAAKWTRAICGHWIFTWNAFRIDCDPDSALAGVEVFDLSAGDLHAGAQFEVAGARIPAVLRKVKADGNIFEAKMDVDADLVRHAEAEGDVAAGEMLGKPMTLESALQRRSREQVSGTISVTLETDSAGDVRRRTKVTDLHIKSVDGRVETRTATETLERRLIAPAK